MEVSANNEVSCRYLFRPPWLSRRARTRFKLDALARKLTEQGKVRGGKGYVITAIDTTQWPVAVISGYGPPPQPEIGPEWGGV